MKKSQIIVAIEGIDGAGKTTLIRELSHYYNGNISVYKRTSKGKAIDMLVSSKVLQNKIMLQMPIYLLLSYKNYFLLKTKSDILVMDRCFLSNICYFFPKALYHDNLLRRILFFEIKLFPQIIFIIDVKPEIGQNRDLNKKSIEWLKNTRNAYLKAANLKSIDGINIKLLEDSLSIEEKSKIIIEYIEEKKHGN